VALDGSRSRPKATTQRLVSVRAQAARKTEPASNRKESIIVSPPAARGDVRPPRRSIGLSVTSREVHAQKLLLGSSRGCLIHVLLHARFVLCLHLLQLRLLVRRQQLIKLVVNARLGYGQLSLHLGLLSG
jgi:hypothetical protein